MRTIVKGKNVEVPDRVRNYAERKLHRLERLLDDRTDAIVEFSNEMHRSASDAHIAEVTLVIDGRTLRSHAVGISYQAALDDVVDKVERQAVDYKEKPRVRARPEEEKRILRDLADGTAEPGHERRIVKTKRFAIEPMFEEDDGSARICRSRRAWSRRSTALGPSAPARSRSSATTRRRGGAGPSPRRSSH